MSKEKSVKIIKIWEDLQNNDMWDSTWDSIVKYVLPARDDVYTKNNKVQGEMKETKHALYDSSAIHFNELLASALHSMLTNPTLKWFTLTTGDPKLDSRPPVRKWVQALVDSMHQLLQNSNFHTEIHEVYLDLGSIGTGPLEMEEDDDMIFRFKAFPIYECKIKENNLGEVDSLLKLVTMDAGQIYQEYGEGVAAGDSQLMNILKDTKKQFEIIKAVFPRQDVRFGKLGPKNMPFASMHVFKEYPFLLRESGYQEFPYAVPRWSKISGEVYGRSPSLKALPDIRMLNAVKKDFIRALQKRTDPAIFMDDNSAIGRIKFTPGAVNFKRPGTAEPKAFVPMADISAGMNYIESLKEGIKEMYYITQLQLREGPQMTATEVSQRTEENLRILSPVLGRLHFELLRPLITRCLGIMKRRKILPPNMPQELQTVIPNVVYSSQIAKAQKITEATNLIRALEVMQPIASFDPTVIDVLNADAIAREIGNLYDVTETIYREESEVAEIRNAKAQQQQQMQQAQQQNMEADSIGKVSKLVNNTSGAF
jgi:hypothetical protein